MKWNFDGKNALKGCKMEVYITDENLNDILMVDTARSVIWHGSYCGAGDFELFFSASEEIIKEIKEGYFAYREDNDTLMIVEKITQKTDVENGDYVVISGRSAEGILARRIIWNQTNLNGKVTDEVMRLIRENLTAPADAKRKVSLLKEGSSVASTDVVQRQLRGEELLTCITEILSSCGLGLRIRKEEKALSLDIIKGTDRSEGNPEGIPEVIFSEEFDNLITSEHIRDYTDHKNVALVAGEGEGAGRITGMAGDAGGLSRREIFVDSSASTNDGQISAGEYSGMLVGEGDAALAETKVSETFQGEVISYSSFTPGKDYFLGDIVTLKNIYGMSVKVRITDFTENADENGENFVISYENL